MNCKCIELKEWLHKEIVFLQGLEKELLPNSKLHNRVSGKIDAYLILLEVLN